jgi:hypothetical protein
VESIEDGLRRVAELPSPNPAARLAAESHDVRGQARKVVALLERTVRASR